MAGTSAIWRISKTQNDGQKSLNGLPRQEGTRQDNFESRPTDARPLFFLTVNVRCHTHLPNFCLRSFACETRALRAARNNSGPENEDQAYSRSHFLRIRAATTQGRRSNKPTLPDQLWASIAGVRSPFILLRPLCSNLCRLCQEGDSVAPSSSSMLTRA